MSKKNYKTTYLYLWLLLAVGLAVVCAISFSEDGKFGVVELTQAPIRDVVLAPELSEEEKAEMERLRQEEEADFSREVIAETDTTVSRVLIFGDSMTILVANRLAAYGEKNGYKVASVTWDGSSTISWSSCDTLDNFIRKYKPDFIMVTLGSNELFLKNFESRKPYVQKILDKIGNIPFVWISPPNWKEDVGFNLMMRSVLPQGTFYNSNKLDLPRGADHIHPTPRGGVIWTDSIMTWMRYTPHPIPSEKPDASVTTRPHDSHYYRAGKGGGGGTNGGQGVAPSEASEELPAMPGDQQPEAEQPAVAPVHEPSVPEPVEQSAPPAPAPEPAPTPPSEQ